MLLKTVAHLLPLFGALICCSACAKEWPAVIPASQAIKVDDFRRAAGELVIQGNGRRNIYKLSCHAGDFAEPDFDYSGLIQCRLVDLQPGATGPDLLNQPGATRDWLSRGKFEIAELTGNCAKDKDFGTNRVFLLRGMRIEIQVDDVKEVQVSNKAGAQEANVSYTLRLSVVNEKSAKRSGDRRVALPAPEKSSVDCSKKQQWWSQKVPGSN